MALLPGEDAVAFEKLYDDLIIEWNPVGPLETDIVASIAHLTWRKQNLSTYRKDSTAPDYNLRSLRSQEPTPSCSYASQVDPSCQVRWRRVEMPRVAGLQEDQRRSGS